MSERAGKQPNHRPGVGSEHPPLRGRGLRFVLVNELTNRPSMTVAEMVVVLRRYGFRLGGRASKVVSDALRWEVRRGRVARLSRGLYRYHQAPASTLRRIRRLAEHATTWAVATTRRQPLPPPPWDDLAWLWTT